jgi:tetratricopeptide (TPR) repeat protein
LSNGQVCDDEHTYVMFSFAWNSCSRNHGRYTHCSYHFNERHTNRHKDAETAYSEAVAIRKQLAADFPTRPEFRKVLASRHFKLGDLLMGTGRVQEAETVYTEALSMAKQLTADFPDQPDLQYNLAGRLGSLARVCMSRRDFNGAKARLEEASAYLQAALRANPQNPTYRLGFRNHFMSLVRACAGMQDQVAALQTAEKLRDVGWDPPANAYDAGCSLASAIPVVKADQQLDSAKRESAVQFYADEAMKMLDAAVGKGFKNAAHMMNNTDLHPLRDREDFQKLIQNLEK